MAGFIVLYIYTMRPNQLFIKTISCFICMLFFSSCHKDKTVKSEIKYQELTLEDKIDGTWHLMTYYIYRIVDGKKSLLNSPKIELREPIETSYINFSTYQDLEFKTPNGRSLYRSWKIKDSTIYAGCWNNIPKDCNFGNTHALLRGAFKITYMDEQEIELICKSNFEPGSKTIELVRLLKKNEP